MKEELLRLDNLTLRDDLRGSVSGVSLLLSEGECFTVMGLNNSGRNILVRMFYGCGQVENGAVYVRKKRMKEYTRGSFERCGVYFIDLKPPFLNSLDLSENFFLLRRNRLKKFLLNEKAIHLRTERILQTYGIDCPADAPLSRFGPVDRFLIALVRAVDQGAKLLVLSDVTQMFSHADLPRLIRLLNRFKEQGLGLLISDNQPEVFENLTDCLTVMDAGKIEKKIFSRTQFEIGRQIMLKNLGVSSKDGDLSLPSCQTIERECRPAIRYEGICLNGRDRFDLEAEKGEIVLLAVPESLEQQKLWRFLTGDGASKPNVELEDRRLAACGKNALIKNRVVFWENGAPSNEILTNLSAEENILLPSLRRISSPLGFYRARMEHVCQDTSFFSEPFAGINTENLTENERILLILNRWKLFRPRVLLLYNIISAADAVGRSQISRGLTQMAARGTAVILIEADVKFCADFAERIFAVSSGQLSGPFRKADLNGPEWELLLKGGEESRYEE